MSELRLQHCADYDRYSVQTTRPELLQAIHVDDAITVGIGCDQLTRATYRLNMAEARRLAGWLNHELDKETK